MNSPSRATVLLKSMVIGAAFMTTTCGDPPPPPESPPKPPSLRVDGTRLDVDIDCSALPSCTGSTIGLVEALPRVESAATPEWDEPPSTDSLEPPEDPSVVEVHLDISYPMAGFLPPTSLRNELSTFHLVAQNVAQHMAGVYGKAGGVTVRWRGIGHKLVTLPRPLHIGSGLFDGRSTRLDLSIESVLADFRSGRAEAAALVTDLMATGEGTGVTGPLTVANALGEWLRSEDVRSGVFHVGMLGVQAEYWGVTHPTECRPGPPLGCWYDERLPGFRRLDSVVRLPFYVLVLGRGADAVTSVLESLQRGVVELDRDVEAQWELLTRRSLGFDTTLSCTAGGPGTGEERQPQYTLSVDQRQQHCCVRDEWVTLFCDFTNGFRPKDGRGIWEQTPAGDSDNDQASVTKDAGRDSDAGLELRLGVTGTVHDPRADWRVRIWAQRSTGNTTMDNTVDWSDWSTEVAALGKTMQLKRFVHAVQIEPDRYRVELPAILRFPGLLP